MISRRSSKPPTQPGVPLWMHDSHWCRVAANASLCPQESQLELILSPGRLLSQNLLYGPSCCPKRAMLCFYEKILPVAYHSTPSAIPSLGFLSSTLLCWLFTMMFHTMSFGSFSFGMVIHLKITIGGSFCLDALQLRTQVKCVLSWPVVFNVTDSLSVSFFSQINCLYLKRCIICISSCVFMMRVCAWRAKWLFKTQLMCFNQT